MKHFNHQRNTEIIDSLQKRIAELEDSFDDLERENKLLEDLLRRESRRSDVHNLEQQAKGVEDYAKESCVGIDGAWMVAKASKLREQAKQLKENQ